MKADELPKAPRSLLHTAVAVAALVTSALGAGCGAGSDDPSSADDALTATADGGVKTIEIVSSLNHDRMTFAYLEAGPADGPRVFLMHGFPDTAHTWDKLMPELANAGYHAIAPFMRGYAPSSPAQDSFLREPDYSAVATGHDVLDLIKAFNAKCGTACGNQKAVVIGHDWGALATYTAAALDDSLIRKLVTVSIPHPSVTNPASADFLPGGKSDHFAYLGLDPFALHWFSAHDFQGVEHYYRKWSPTWTFEPSETEWAKKSFRSSGAKGAIGYYKSLAHLTRGAELLALNRTRTRVPTLTFYGKDDGATSVDNFLKTPPAFVGCAADEGGAGGASCHYELVAVPHAGHFLHRENPALFAEEVLAFLGPAH